MVDGEKNKKADFKEAFLSLPEEDMFFKYFEHAPEKIFVPVHVGKKTSLTGWNFLLAAEGGGWSS